LLEERPEQSRAQITESIRDSLPEMHGSAGGYLLKKSNITKREDLRMDGGVGTPTQSTVCV